MSEITSYIHSTVKDLEGYKALAKKMTAFVRDNEPGTTTYDWHLSDDNERAFNVDGFDSTESFLTHMGNVQSQGFLDEFMAVLDISRVIVTGAPGEEAAPLLEQFGAEVLSEVASL